jgi:hypothetical protein
MAQLSDGVKKTAATAAKAVSAESARVAANLTAAVTEADEMEKEQGAEALMGLARAVDDTAKEVDEVSPKLGDYVRRAARKVEDLSEQVSQQRVSDVVEAASELARRRPVAVAAGAGAVAAAGLALAGVLRSGKRSTKAIRSSPAKRAKKAKGQPVVRPGRKSVKAGGRPVGKRK